MTSNTPETGKQPAPFELSWVRGYNARAGVLLLSGCDGSEGSEESDGSGGAELLYAAAHSVVLYDWTKKRMRILQAHRHAVAGVAVAAAGGWLASWDAGGADGCVALWARGDTAPRRTLFAPHAGAPLAQLALSSDARYLLTLAGQERVWLHWWIWAYGLDSPHATLQVDVSAESVVAIGFNPDDSRQFVLLTRQHVWLGVSDKVFVVERGITKETDDYRLEIRKVETKLSAEDGHLTCFTFVRQSARLVAGTSCGAVLLYGDSFQLREGDGAARYEELRFIKLVKLDDHQINVITSVDDCVVTGCSGGEVRYHDRWLRALRRLRGGAARSVRGLSFGSGPTAAAAAAAARAGPHGSPCLAAGGGALSALHPPIVRNFIICTENEGIVFVDVLKEKFQTIVDCTPAYATALSVHPERPLVCVGFADGSVELLDFIQHSVLSRQRLQPESPAHRLALTCLKYSPSGVHLVSAMSDGSLHPLHPGSVSPLGSALHDSHHAVHQLSFSEDSLCFAAADTGRTVRVYKYECGKREWRLLGKQRAHYKEITQLCYTGETSAGGGYRLLSLGLDRALARYEAGECLVLRAVDRVLQSSVPLAALPWRRAAPAPGAGAGAGARHASLPLLLLADDQFKYKIVNYETATTLRTVLGPRSEAPVHRLLLAAGGLLLAAGGLLGTQRLPLDGAPDGHVLQLGHPRQVTEMCFREDLGILFTIGAKDCCMMQWSTNCRAEEAERQGGGDDDPLQPYHCLLEGGRCGPVYREIRDLFYYVQTLGQGEYCPGVRTVGDRVPVSVLPDLVRGLGYCPTESEAEQLLVEAQYDVSLRAPRRDVDFEQLVKLYLNHRPAFGDSYRQLRAAFCHFASVREQTCIMTRDRFLQVLADYGECFPREYTLHLCAVMRGPCTDSVEPDDLIPAEITFDWFVSELLGIQHHSAADSLSDHFHSHSDRSHSHSDH